MQPYYATMKEIALSQSQVEESFDALDSAVQQTFGSNRELFIPDQQHVPYPDFHSLAGNIETHTGRAPDWRNGRIALKPRDAYVLGAYEGLRGLAQIVTSDGRGGRKLITGPAIVLRGGQQLAMLIAEQPSPTISKTQHGLLETEYAKHLAAVKRQHSPADASNAGAIAPALVVASSGLGANAHTELHTLASSGGSDTFGSNFSLSSRQDIQVGHNIRYVRSAIIPTNNAVLHIGEHDQLDNNGQLFNIALSASQLAVGMTLAATQSRLSLPSLAQNERLRRNLSAMANA